MLYLGPGTSGEAEDELEKDGMKERSRRQLLFRRVGVDLASGYVGRVTI
jgi:hypothetical protein